MNAIRTSQLRESLKSNGHRDFWFVTVVAIVP